MKEQIKKIIDEIDDNKFLELLYSLLIKRKNKHI